MGTFIFSEPLKTGDLIDIWPNAVGPGSEKSPAVFEITERSNLAYSPDRIATGITKPNLTAFVPDRPNGTVVIAAPGGAYARIVLDKEAGEMAYWLNRYGVTVLLMQYRLPAEGHVNGKNVPLQDAQRAMRVVRQRAKEWGLDPHKIGFLGASAAGHMGAILGTQFNKKVYESIDGADSLSARPAFEIFLYPVISMYEELTHLESRTNLIGKNPSDSLIRAYSAELHVRHNTPQTFIVVAENDPAVPSANAIVYYEALKKAGVQSELHVFKEGGHGFGILNARQLPVSDWPNLAANWLKRLGYIE